MVVPPLSIFISYARAADSKFVDSLEADLRTRGFRPWVDRRKLEGGQTWADELEKAIRNCDIFLVVLSPQSVESPHVRRECRMALRLNKPVIPLYRRKCEPFLDIEGIQWIDFTHDDEYEYRLDSLQNDLRVRVAKLQLSAVSPVSQQTPDASPALLPNSPRRIKRRKVVLGGLGVLAIAVVGGVYEVISHAFGLSYSQTPIATKLSKGWNPIETFSPSRDVFGIAPFTSSDGKQRVLIDGGGYYSGEYLADCEIFDPGRGMWMQTKSLPYGRREHSSTLLSDSDKILVAGGYGVVGESQQFLDEALLFDPGSENWKQTAVMNQERTQHSAVQLDNDRVFIVGGWNGQDGILTSSEIYDYNNGLSSSWTLNHDMMKIGRQLPGCVVVPYKNGSGVLVTGGFTSPINSRFNGRNETELYDLQTQSWVSLAPMNIGRWGFGILWLPKPINKVLVVGGLTSGASDSLQGAKFTSSAELYDVESNKWTRIADMANERGAFDGSSNAILLNDGTVLVVGNDAISSGIGEVTSEVLVLNHTNPDASTWDSPVMVQSNGHTNGRCALLKDTGQVLFVGRDFAFIYKP